MVRTCLILAGGLGTRLRSVVADRPKPMAEVKGRPFITFLFDQLIRFNVERAVICLGHLGEYVPPVLGDRYGPLQLAYSFESSPLGTGGALRNARALVADANFLVLNGDSLSDVDLRAVDAMHLRTGAALTLVALHREDRRRSGAVTVDGEGRVVAFESRPSVPTPGLINAGIYVVRRDVLNLIAPERNVSLEDDVMQLLVRQRSLYAWIGEGEFIDIGTPESYLALRSV